MTNAPSGAPPLVVVAGATATGKTGLSVRLASALREDGRHVEIVSADSRQVYRGLDIGTAKIPPDERAGIPHHGLDLVDPDQPFTVADFADHVAAVLPALADANGVVVLVGGTGLYLRAVARGLALDDLPWDPDLRRELNERLATDGLDALVADLRDLAPTDAARVDVRNPRRVVRALELARLRGDRPRPQPRGYPGPVLWLGLALDPATNRQWIARRARQQFDAGLVDEADRLRHRWDPTLPAFTAIGYHEAWGVLDGELDLEAAIELDARRNAAFARRQRTWFRREPGLEWIDATDPDGRALELVRRFVDERLS